MKKIISAVFVCTLMVSAYSCSSGHYVSAQPNEVIVNRPIAPGPGYVWVDGDYYWNGGAYRYRNGYWARPRAGRVWNRGAWVNSPRGYYWRRGGWR